MDGATRVPEQWWRKHELTRQEGQTLHRRRPRVLRASLEFA